MSQGVEEVPARQGSAGALRVYIRTFAHLRPNARRLLLGNVCISVGVGLFGVLFNLYLITIGYGLVFIGVISAATTVGQAGVAPLVGWLLRRFDTRAVLAAGAGAMALGLALSAVITSSAVLLAAAALSGAGLSIATIPASPYMMEHSTSSERSHLFSAYFASNTIGSMIGSLLSGAIPAIVGLWLAHGHGHGHNGEIGDRIGLLAGAFVTAAAIWLFWSMSHQELTEASTERPALPLEESVAETRIARDVAIMLGVTAVIALTMGATLPFLNVYFSDRLHASTATIGSIYALSGVVCTVAAFVAPALGRWGRLSGFSTARVLTAPAFMLFWLHPGLPVAAAAYIMRNSFGTISGALENTFAMEILPARLRATVASWRSFAFNAGWTIGSLAAGVVVARFGYDILFVAAAIITVAGSITYYLRFRGGAPAAAAQAGRRTR